MRTSFVCPGFDCRRPTKRERKFESLTPCDQMWSLRITVCKLAIGRNWLNKQTKLDQRRLSGATFAFGLRSTNCALWWEFRVRLQSTSAVHLFPFCISFLISISGFFIWKTTDFGLNVITQSVCLVLSDQTCRQNVCVYIYTAFCVRLWNNKPMLIGGLEGVNQNGVREAVCMYMSKSLQMTSYHKWRTDKGEGAMGNKSFPNHQWTWNSK